MLFRIAVFLAVFFPIVSHAQAPQKPGLKVTPLNDRVLIHTTYGVYQNAAVPSNGLIIKTADGVVLVDTGWDDDGNLDNSRQLIAWVRDSLRQPIRLCIATHAHADRVGGTKAFREAGIRVVSTPLTARKSEQAGYGAPEAVLPNDTTFTVGGEPIRCYFPGEGHTSDNIVVWLPNQRILHGGCFVKSVAAFGMGYLGDANLKEWGTSVRRVMQRFGTARVVVPGHDAWGDAQALRHTLNLLEKHAAGRR